MRKIGISVALVIAVAGAFAFSTYREFARPPALEGCFDYDGRKLFLSEGRLLVDGSDVGSFRHSRGDATKGPDTITVGAPPDTLKSIGLDPRRVWRVANNGIQVPLGSGEYETAAPCGR